MRRDQLEHAIRTACQIIGHDEVIVVGSQAILGSYDETDLPPLATMSMEVDVLPMGADTEETTRLADRIDGVAGELSQFEQTHGFSIDGVDLSTSILPAAWRERLVEVNGPLTEAPGTGRRCTGWCLDVHDLCVAKMCAHRTKDRNFVRALLDAGLVEAEVLTSRLQQVDGVHAAAVTLARDWLESWSRS
ncbi:DUF6036 family nucleotidyltransferase [Nocardioides marmoraquaticus]